MKKIYLALLVVVGCEAVAQFNPQTKELTEKFFPEKEDLPEVTPALKKAKGFTTYAEMMTFLNEISTQFPDFVQLKFIGKTKKGVDIPLLIIGNLHEDEKLRVWLQGGLHGDEPASTEALLYLIYDLLHNQENRKLIENLHIAILPMANIDGYVKLQRNNAENLDLNRDQTKLMAVETPLLKKAYSEFSPQVALDFHEFRPFRRDFLKMGEFGVTSSHDVMFLYTGNLNVPQEQRVFTQEKLLEPTRKVLNENDLKHHDYVTTVQRFGEVQFNRGAISARSSVTNFALQNALATLVEVRGVGIGRTSFKRRIFTGYLVAKSFLDQSLAHAVEIQELIQKNQNPDSIVVRAHRNQYQDTFQVIDVDKNEYLNMPVTYNDALQSQAKLVRDKPLAYLLEPSLTPLIEKLQYFGFEVQQLETDQEIEVEQYRIKSLVIDSEKYEKMNMQEVVVEVVLSKIILAKNTFYILTDQSKSSLLTEILEPEADNSFVSFGLIKAEENKTLPLYRLTKTTPIILKK